jgi:hypothetical protein
MYLVICYSGTSHMVCVVTYKWCSFWISSDKNYWSCEYFLHIINIKYTSLCSRAAMTDTGHKPLPIGENQNIKMVDAYSDIEMLYH